MKQSASSKRHEIPKVDDVNFIQKNNGFVKGYAVNTFHGMAKNYNQDRVSIIMNITKPNFKGRWPKCSYFGVFDGHGGSACSDFLKDNMHKYITQNQHFPHNPIQALKCGFKNAQGQFLKMAQSKNPVQRSGSCAIVLLIIDQICYVANVGDSRAILSTKTGKQVYGISRDHKPDSDSEKARIFQAGGNIYQSSMKAKNGNIIYGPFRIQPGKLSVSRSFGDIEAKYPQYGGNPKVLVAKPEITYFTINPKQHDFIMMGSDGIFDKMQNQQIVQEFWNLQSEAALKSSRSMQKSNQQPLSFIGKAASRIITKAMQHVSLDNLTSLLVIFEDQGKLTQFSVNNSKKTLSCLSSQTQHKKAILQNPTPPIQASQFNLKRELSRPHLSQPLSTRSQKQVKQSKEPKQPKQSNKDIYNIRKKSSIYRQEENRQELANRQQGSMDSLGKASTIRDKDREDLVMQLMKRKKSQTSLNPNKQTKKQSVWNTINRGLNNVQKLDKIRY